MLIIRAPRPSASMIKWLDSLNKPKPAVKIIGTLKVAKLSDLHNLLQKMEKAA